MGTCSSHSRPTHDLLTCWTVLHVVDVYRNTWRPWFGRQLVWSFSKFGHSTAQLRDYILNGYRKCSDHYYHHRARWLMLLYLSFDDIWRFYHSNQTHTDRCQCKLLCLPIFPKYVSEVMGTWSSHSRRTHNLLTCWTVLHVIDVYRNTWRPWFGRQLVWSFSKFGHSTAQLRDYILNGYQKCSGHYYNHQTRWLMLSYLTFDIIYVVDVCRNTWRPWFDRQLVWSFSSLGIQLYNWESNWKYILNG